MTASVLDVVRTFAGEDVAGRVPARLSNVGGLPDRLNELVTNGDFKTDAGWDLYGDDGAGQDTEITGGLAKLYSDGVDQGGIAQAISFVSGITYRVAVDSAVISGNWNLITTNNPVAGTVKDDVRPWSSNDGEEVITFTATANASHLYIRQAIAAGTETHFNSISIKRIG